MYERIKQLADEAIALQNKARMEEVLREIGGMCAHARRPLDLGEYEYGFPPAKMTAEQFEADALATHRAARANPAVEMSITGGFGMARIKKEGAAAHPDDIEAEMTPEQEARQLAAYARDTGDVPVAARAETVQHQAARGTTIEVPAGERLEMGDPVVIVKGAAKRAAKK